MKMPLLEQLAKIIEEFKEINKFKKE